MSRRKFLNGSTYVDQLQAFGRCAGRITRFRFNHICDGQPREAPCCAGFVGGSTLQSVRCTLSHPKLVFQVIENLLFVGHPFGVHF